MRSVITLILLLIVVGGTLLYTMKGGSAILDGFYGNGGNDHRASYGRGWEAGGGTGESWSWNWYGILPFPQNIVAEQPVVKESPIEQQCSTDLDCVQGHCSMFGVCTNGFSL